MTKKAISILIACAITLSVSVNAIAKETIQAEQKSNSNYIWSDSGINVAVNGKKIEFPDQRPLFEQINERTYIPVRFLAEAFGAEVDWDQEHQVVSIINPQIEGSDTRAIHYLKIGEDKLITVQYNNGKNAEATHATVFYFGDDIYPIVINDRTMLPFRYVAELLGAQVYYDKATTTANCIVRNMSMYVSGREYSIAKGDTGKIQEAVDSGMYLKANGAGASQFDSYPILSTVIGKYFVEELNEWRKNYYGRDFGVPNQWGQVIYPMEYSSTIADIAEYACIDHITHPEFYDYDGLGMGYSHVFSNNLPPSGNIADAAWYEYGTVVQDRNYVTGALKPFYKEYYPGYISQELQSRYRENATQISPVISNIDFYEVNGPEMNDIRNNWGLNVGTTTKITVLNENAYREISQRLIREWANTSPGHQAVLAQGGSSPNGGHYVGVSIWGEYAYMNTVGADPYAYWDVIEPAN